MKHPILAATCWLTTLLLTASSPAQTPGSLDATFGTNGTALVDVLPDFEESAAYLTVLANGKTLVVGDCDRPNTGRDFALYRLNANGSPDISFGAGGVVTESHNLNEERNDVCVDGVLQSDGKIVLAGVTTVGTPASPRLLLMRFNSNGTLDATFGQSGKIVLGVSNSSLMTWRAVALQSDGKIVAVGRNGAGFTLARFTANGQPDATFGGVGFSIFNTSNFTTSEGYDVAVQPDGKIVAVGSDDTATPVSSLNVIRLNTDGTPDATFGNGGVTRIQLVKSSVATKVALLANGQILAGGFTTNNAGQQVATLLRFNSDGSLDDTFGDNGLATLHWSSGSDFVSGLYVQPDGRIVLSGHTLTNQFQYAASRFLADGTPDTGFGTNGVSLTSVGSPATAACGVPGPNNTFVVAGSATFNGGQNVAVVRYALGSTVGVAAEPAVATDLRVWPNPVAEQFDCQYFLRENARVSLSLCDASGRAVHRFATAENRQAGGQQETLLWPAHLPAGTYWLLLNDLAGRVSGAPMVHR